MFHFTPVGSGTYQRNTLCFQGTNHVAGGFMVGLVGSSTIKKKKVSSDGRVNAYMTIVPIATEWERLLALIATVRGRGCGLESDPLQISTIGQGVIVGSIPSKSGDLDTMIIPIYYWHFFYGSEAKPDLFNFGASSPMKGLKGSASSNTGVWKEKWANNERMLWF
jgi:hypothetical protein